MGDFTCQRLQLHLSDFTTLTSPPFSQHCPSPPPKPCLVICLPADVLAYLLDLGRMPFFLIFLACLISALVLRFITVCHMWSCGHADGNEEEEQMLSTEEKEVTITVIGSDSRKASAESAFENCRLVVDASVYI